MIARRSSASSSASRSISACGCGSLDRGVQRQRRQRPAAFQPMRRSRVIDQNAAHQLRGDPEKVRPILPLHVPLVDQLEVGLVHERGALERVIGALAREIPAGNRPELPVDERHQPFERLRAAILPLDQQLGDLRRSGHGEG